MYGRGSSLATPILKDPSKLKERKYSSFEIGFTNHGSNVLLNYCVENHVNFIVNTMQCLFGIMVSMWIVIITMVYHDFGKSTVKPTNMHCN